MPQDFLPTASAQTLHKRAEIYRQVRTFFDTRGFIEVETPLLSADSVMDRHLHPLQIDRNQITGRDRDFGQSMFFQTSPEFGMKRLLAAGATSIYQICKAFRCGEAGEKHNPEFTMLEWYRVGDDMQAGIQLLCDFTQTILQSASPQKISYRDAMLTHANIDPFTSTDDELQQKAELTGNTVDRDECLNVILAMEVEPKLGVDAPTILFDYPASQAALAITRDEKTHSVAERFELYINGVELANGYHELLDADELSRRNQTVAQQRLLDGARPLPAESRLLEAMKYGLPACSGTALGMDRLIMLAMGASSIDEVVAFPFDRA
ncbi:UNVERIFIED_CONTAM: hypothetical protein GTU68_042644 [Idotea baltica]|nr:hypothetical protein [Idotea baltica]